MYKSVDYFAGGAAHGSVAQRLLRSGMNIKVLRQNAMRANDGVLRKDEWILLDQALLGVMRQRLTLPGDLISRGLTLPIANAMGTLVLQWEGVTDFGPAQIDMDARSRGLKDRVEYPLLSMPLPIIHKEFELSLRVLEASRNGSQPLDTTNVERATRSVLEAQEDQILNGSVTYGGGSVYGYLTHPNRNTITFEGGLAWTHASKTGGGILTDVQAMIAKELEDRHYGPYILYLPVAYFNVLGGDFKAESDKSILSRLKEFANIADIKPVDRMPANTIVLVSLSKETVDLVDGFGPTLVMWETEGGTVKQFMVMAIQAPRVKADPDGRSGVCVGTPS